MSYYGTEDIILLLKNCPSVGKSERKWVQGPWRRPDPLPLQPRCKRWFWNTGLLRVWVGGCCLRKVMVKAPPTHLPNSNKWRTAPKSNQPLTPPRAFCIKTTHFQRMHYSNHQLSLLNRNWSQNHASCLKDTTHRKKNAYRNLLLPRNKTPMHTSHTHTHIINWQTDLWASIWHPLEIISVLTVLKILCGFGISFDDFCYIWQPKHGFGHFGRFTSCPFLELSFHADRRSFQPRKAGGKKGTGGGVVAW